MQQMNIHRNWLAVALTVALALAVSASAHAQVPDMPKPTKAHELLGQFAGEWEVTSECAALPGQEPIKAKGTESAKLVGGFWLVANGEASMAGMDMKSVLTMGYDPAKKKYVGTFLCSMDSTLWTYQGTMDDSGKKLTLETEGPTPFDPAKKVKYREILELKDPDHKVFTSYMIQDDGSLMKFTTMDYKRKK